MKNILYILCFLLFLQVFSQESFITDEYYLNLFIINPAASGFENYRGRLKPYFEGQYKNYRPEIDQEVAASILAIYYQALRLWMKKVPFHPHPPTTAGRRS